MSVSNIPNIPPMATTFAVSTVPPHPQEMELDAQQGISVFGGKAMHDALPSTHQREKSASDEVNLYVDTQSPRTTARVPDIERPFLDQRVDARCHKYLPQRQGDSR